MRSNSGRNLNREWKIGAQHCLYHIGGRFYERLERFPGALCNPNGYILFKTKQEFLNSPYLKIGEKVNVESRLGDVEGIPGFVKMR